MVWCILLKTRQSGSRWALFLYLSAWVGEDTKEHLLFATIKIFVCKICLKIILKTEKQKAKEKDS